MVLAILAFSGLQTQANAQNSNLLASASSFSVLGGSTVTNTGFSVVQGDVGVSPGSAITGFPPGTYGGTLHAGDAFAAQAQIDALKAYNTLAGMAYTVDLTGQNLGGLTLTPGIYYFASSAQLTGALTLNALGNPHSLFIFQIGSTLTTASSASVHVINGGCDDNVYWQVGSSATLGTTTAFEGNILALSSVTLNTGANIEDGRAFGLTGAVTLDTNSIHSPDCPSVTPEGSSIALFFSGCLSLCGLGRRGKTARK